MKVYVVTSGVWSGFHINAMFSTPELASRYVDACSFDEYNECNGIEEWTLDECSYAPPESMNIQGNFFDDTLWDCDFDDVDVAQWRFNVVHNDEGDYVDFTGNVKVRPGETAEKYRERAKKVAIDKYFEWKAKQ